MVRIGSIVTFLDSPDGNVITGTVTEIDYDVCTVMSPTSQYGYGLDLDGSMPFVVIKY